MKDNIVTITTGLVIMIALIVLSTNLNPIPPLTDRQAEAVAESCIALNQRVKIVISKDIITVACVKDRAKK